MKRLKEELDGMIKKKLEVEKELAKEKAKKADELKETLDIATEEIKKVCVRMRGLTFCLLQHNKGADLC